MKTCKKGKKQDKKSSILENLTRRDFIKYSAIATAGTAFMYSSCKDNNSNNNDAGFDAGQDTATQDIGGDGGTEIDLNKRIVRVFDPNVTDWDRSGDDYYNHIDQSHLETMLDKGVAELTGKNATDAWKSLFPVVNSVEQDKIFIKLNFNAAGDNPSVNNSGPMVCAVIKGLIDQCGFAQANITVCDPSRDFMGIVKDYCAAQYPDVSYPNGGDIAYADTNEVKFTFPKDIFIEPPTNDRQMAIPQILVDCDHFVNLHSLKGHWGVITGAMKNLFGLTPNVYATYHGGGDDPWGEWEYSPHVARLAIQDLVIQKTRLLISEAIFTTDEGAAEPPGRPKKPELYRVKNVETGDVDPRCLFVGINQACHDSVLVSAYDPDVESDDERLDWLRYADATGGNSSYYHDVGIFEIGQVIDGNYTEKDLKFNRIDYRSVHV